MKLFHCIVVMGAAMGAGCGGEGAPTASPVRDGAAGGPAGDGPLGSSEDAAVTDSGCFPETAPPVNGFSAPVPLGCEVAGPCDGTHEDPLGPGQCAHPQQLQCANAPPYPTVSTTHGCTCNTTAPLVPTDCPQTTQFNCIDWTSPCGCWCEPNSPTAPSDCTHAPPEAGSPWTCHSYDPPVGCECLTVPPPIL